MTWRQPHSFFTMNPAFPPMLGAVRIGEQFSVPPIIVLAAVGLFVLLGSVIAWKVSKLLMKLTLVLVILLAGAGAVWWHFARPR